jgi:hypothetical protein
MQLTGPGLLLALRPLHDRGIVDLDQLLALQLAELLYRLLRPVGGVELPHRQRRHGRLPSSSRRDSLAIRDKIEESLEPVFIPQG